MSAKKKEKSRNDPLLFGHAHITPFDAQASSATPQHSAMLFRLVTLLCVSTLWTGALAVSDITFSSSARRDHRPEVVVRHYTLNVTSTTLWQGCEPFGGVVVNGSFPGPTLRARAGEILQVRVWNYLADQNLTMHFHGLAMIQHPVMDGTTLVSQWPIYPGRLFDYRIPLTAEDKGTYFYHSHAGVQAMTAHGALVVEDPSGPYNDPAQLAHQEEKHPGSVKLKHVQGAKGLKKGGGSDGAGPYSWDEDRVLALGDWWGYSSLDRIHSQLNADPFAWPGSATKLLLNGQSTPLAAETCNATKAQLVGVDCKDAPACGAGVGWPEVQLDYGKTYRLRMVGAVSLMYVSAAILEPGSNRLQNLTLIEADGSYLAAQTVDRVELASGQRYSVLYTAPTRKEVEKDRSGGVHWMRIESRWRAGPSMWVKLTYPSARHSSPAVVDPPSVAKDARLLPNETFGWVTADMAPLRSGGGEEWWYADKMPRDDQVTRTVVIDTQQVKFYASKRGVRWDENGEVFDDTDVPTPAPYLVRTMLGDITLPSADQFNTALLNPTSYNTSSGVQPIVNATSSELAAAAERRWAQAYDSRLNMYFARQHEVIDIVLVNRPSQLSSQVEIHPWHMHSHKHWTRTIHPGTFSFSRLNAIYASNPNFTNPIQRDTSIVYASPGAAYLNQSLPSTNDDGGFAVLRYKVKSNNAGFFLLHCHLQFHLAMGMATVWSINPAALNPLHANTHNIQGLDPAYLTPGTNVPALT